MEIRVLVSCLKFDGAAYFAPWWSPGVVLHLQVGCRIKQDLMFFVSVVPQKLSEEVKKKKKGLVVNLCVPVCQRTTDSQAEV